MKSNVKKIRLNRETVRSMTHVELIEVNGAGYSKLNLGLNPCNTPGCNAFYIYSDIQLKIDVTPIVGALDLLASL